MIARHNFNSDTPAPDAPVRETMIRLAVQEAKATLGDALPQGTPCAVRGCRHPAAMETQFGMLCMNDALRAVQQARAAARQEGMARD
jgi:hypothetical protein